MLPARHQRTEPSGAGQRRRTAPRRTAATTADVESYPGVLSARAALTGPRHRPDLHLEITAGTDVGLADLRERIADHALPRLRSAMDIDGLHADLILRLDTTEAGSPSVR